MPFSPMLLLGGRGGGRIGYIVLLFALYLFLSARHPGEGKQRGALRRFDKMFGSRPSLPKSTQASQSSPVSPQYSPASTQLGSVSDRRPQREEGD